MLKVTEIHGNEMEPTMLVMQMPNGTFNIYFSDARGGFDFYPGLDAETVEALIPQGEAGFDDYPISAQEMYEINMEMTQAMKEEAESIIGQCQMCGDVTRRDIDTDKDLCRSCLSELRGE